MWKRTNHALDDFIIKEFGGKRSSGKETCLGGTNGIVKAIILGYY